MPTKKPSVKKPQLPLLSRREVDDLKARIDHDKAVKGDAKGQVIAQKLPEGAIPVREAGVEFDNGAVERRIQRSERTLAALDPANHRLTGAERQRGERRYAELSELLPKRMLTRQEMDYFPAKSGDHDANLKEAVYGKAVEKACDFKNGEHSPQFVELAIEWKRLGRLLWPEDPERCNLETLRPNGESSGRHFRTRG